MRYFWLKSLILISFSGLCLCSDITAAPNSISYQGRLRESGQPVSGIRNFNFKLFTEASIGTQIWTSGDIAVLVSSGIYSTQIGNDAIKSLDFANNDYWLEISVGGNAFSPRERISAVPYAFNASTAANVMGAGNIRMSGAAGNHWILNGNVGIGLTNPVQRVDLVGNINLNGGALLGIYGNIAIGGINMGWYSDAANLAARFPGANGDFYVQSSSGSLTYMRSGAAAGGTLFLAGNVGIGTTAPTAALDINGDLRVQDPSSIGNLHYFLASQYVNLVNGGTGGPTDTDVSAYVPSTAKGAVLRVLVISGPAGACTLAFADRAGNFASLPHYFQNGFTNYSSTTWVGGVVYAPFYTGKRFKWKLQSNSADPDTTGTAIIGLMGWF